MAGKVYRKTGRGERAAATRRQARGGLWAGSGTTPGDARWKLIDFGPGTSKVGKVKAKRRRGGVFTRVINFFFFGPKENRKKIRRETITPGMDQLLRLHPNMYRQRQTPRRRK